MNCRSAFALLACAALSGCGWEAPQACRQGKKAEGLWAAEGLPVGGTSAVCDRSSAEVFSVAHADDVGKISKAYDEALLGKGWKKIGVDGEPGRLASSYLRGGVVLTGSFSDLDGGTNVEITQAACAATPIADKGWPDIDGAIGPDKGYVCSNEHGTLVLLVPGLDLEAACKTLAKPLEGAGYKLDPKADARSCSFIKDTSSAYTVTAHSPLASYPTEWIKVGVRKRW